MLVCVNSLETKVCMENRFSLSKVYIVRKTLQWPNILLIATMTVNGVLLPVSVLTATTQMR